MINFRTNHKTVDTNEAAIFTLLGSNAEGVTLFLINRDDTNYVNYRIKTSNDGITYAALAEGSGNTGVTGIIAPAAKVMVSLRTAAPYVQLLADASGGAELDFGIAQFVPQGSNLTNGVL